MTSLGVVSQEDSQNGTGTSRDVIILTTEPTLGVDVAMAVDDGRCVQNNSRQSHNRGATTTRTFQCSVEGCGKIFTSATHLKVFIVFIVYFIGYWECVWVLVVGGIESFIGCLLGTRCMWCV